MTIGRKVHSGSQDWGTPQKYVTAVLRVLDSIELDPCSNEHSIVPAITEYRLPDNGLNLSWNFKKIYCNPPYGKDWERKTSIKDWLYKCAEAHQKYESEVLALIPVATNTSHWKLYVWASAIGICFLYDTRLKFLQNGIPSEKGAPMPCAMVYWGKNFEKFKEVFKEYGAVIKL